MQHFLSTPKAHVTHWFLLALAGFAYVVGCGDSEEGTPSNGKGGSAGSSAAGKAGSSAGLAGKASSGGKSGAAGAGAARGGGAGDGGDPGMGGDAGDPGSGGHAGDPGSGGHAGDGQGGTQAGQAGEGGEGGVPAGLSGTTCAAILADEPTAPTGVYLIDPDGSGGDPAVSVVCDMVTEGGGWTLGLIKNSLHDGQYQTFASGRVTPEALATTPEAASAATGASATAGWIDLNDFPYTELEITGYLNGTETYRSDPIPKADLRIPFGTDGYYLYDQVNAYYWCGGTSAFTTDGIGQVMKPSGAPDDCKGHTSLGDGWDFGTAGSNEGLTVCGGGSRLMTTSPASSFVTYGAPGAAQAIWVR